MAPPDRLSRDRFLRRVQDQSMPLDRLAEAGDLRAALAAIDAREGAGDGVIEGDEWALVFDEALVAGDADAVGLDPANNRDAVERLDEIESAAGLARVWGRALNPGREPPRLDVRVDPASGGPGVRPRSTQRHLARLSEDGFRWDDPPPHLGEREWREFYGYERYTDARDDRLGVGTYGPAVRDVQRRLITAGYLPAGEDDGKWGVATERAYRRGVMIGDADFPPLAYHPEHDEPGTSQRIALTVPKLEPAGLPLLDVDDRIRDVDLSDLTGGRSASSGLPAARVHERIGEFYKRPRQTPLSGQGLVYAGLGPASYALDDRLLWKDREDLAGGGRRYWYETSGAVTFGDRPGSVSFKLYRSYDDPGGDPYGRAKEVAETIARQNSYELPLDGRRALAMQVGFKLEVSNKGVVSAPRAVRKVKAKFLGEGRVEVYWERPLNAVAEDFALDRSQALDAELGAVMTKTAVLDLDTGAGRRAYERLMAFDDGAVMAGHGVQILRVRDAPEVDLDVEGRDGPLAWRYGLQIDADGTGRPSVYGAYTPSLGGDLSLTGYVDGAAKIKGFTDLLPREMHAEEARMGVGVAAAYSPSEDRTFSLDASRSLLDRFDRNGTRFDGQTTRLDVSAGAGELFGPSANVLAGRYRYDGTRRTVQYPFGRYRRRSDRNRYSLGYDLVDRPPGTLQGTIDLDRRSSSNRPDSFGAFPWTWEAAAALPVGSIEERRSQVSVGVNGTLDPSAAWGAGAGFDLSAGASVAPGDKVKIVVERRPDYGEGDDGEPRVRVTVERSRPWRAQLGVAGADDGVPGALSIGQGREVKRKTTYDGFDFNRPAHRDAYDVLVFGGRLSREQEAAFTREGGTIKASEKTVRDLALEGLISVINAPDAVLQARLRVRKLSAGSDLAHADPFQSGINGTHKDADWLLTEGGLSLRTPFDPPAPLGFSPDVGFAFGGEVRYRSLTWRDPGDRDGAYRPVVLTFDAEKIADDWRPGYVASVEGSVSQTAFAGGQWGAGGASVGGTAHETGALRGALEVRKVDERTVRLSWRSGATLEWGGTVGAAVIGRGGRPEAAQGPLSIGGHGTFVRGRGRDGGVTIDIDVGTEQGRQVLATALGAMKKLQIQNAVDAAKVSGAASIQRTAVDERDQQRKFRLHLLFFDLIVRLFRVAHRIVDTKDEAGDPVSREYVSTGARSSGGILVPEKQFYWFGQALDRDSDGTIEAQNVGLGFSWDGRAGGDRAASRTVDALNEMGAGLSGAYGDRRGAAFGWRMEITEEGWDRIASAGARQYATALSSTVTLEPVGGRPAGGARTPAEDEARDLLLSFGRIPGDQRAAARRRYARLTGGRGLARDAADVEAYSELVTRLTHAGSTDGQTALRLWAEFIGDTKTRGAAESLVLAQTLGAVAGGPGAGFTLTAHADY